MASKKLRRAKPALRSRKKSTRVSVPTAIQSGLVRLDLGAGEASPPGFRPMGRDHGSEIFPLPYPDESVDEIRASHVLEHFPHGQLSAVLADWVRALKKGGLIRIAVPDFAKIAQNYSEKVVQPTEGYLMGGQTDEDDFHRSIFDKTRLGRLLTDQNLVLLRRWTSEIPDTATLPISLNIEARKPHLPELRVSGAMSMPRLAFTDNFFCTMEASMDCSVKLRKHGGAFWDISMTKVFEKILAEDNCDYILTVDYDSIYRSQDLSKLMQLAMVYPEADAIAPVQSSRHLETALFTVHGTEGENIPRIPRKALEPDLMPVPTAHFGLTLISARKLRQLPKPWFRATPDPDGGWDHEKGAVHADISFWRNWTAAGNSLMLANRVVIGHAELMIRWPNENLKVFFQSMSDFRKDGVPQGVWK